MKIDDYVRTKDGNIGRIIRFTTDTIFYVQFYDNIEWKTDLEELGEVEIGDKIIKIVHEGDYVNGYLVYEVKENCVLVGHKCFKTAFDDEEDFLYQTIYEDDIKSIVTKEQFEETEYEVK